MRALSASRPLVFAGTALMTSLLARTGRADEEAVPSTKLAIDVEYLSFSDSPLDSGVGGSLRLGREFAGILSLTPEAGVSYHSARGVHDASVYRGFIGPRLSFGRAIQAGIFGHLGYGHIDFRELSGAPDPSRDALAYDAGVTLDFTLLRVLEVGAHAAYNGLASSHEHDGVHWISAGGHVAFRFMDR